MRIQVRVTITANGLQSNPDTRVVEVARYPR